MLLNNDELLHSLIKIRSDLSDDYIQKLSIKIYRQLGKLEEYRNAKKIGIYHAIKGEVLLDNVWRYAPMHGKSCYFPVYDNDKLLFLAATPKTKFKANVLGILEPDLPMSDAVSLASLDLILTPLVAFDDFGVSLGMNRGFKDGIINNLQEPISKPIVIGMAYDFQYQTFLEKKPSDILLHATVTEKKIYWTNRI